jgi:hypothetical protein
MVRSPGGSLELNIFMLVTEMGLMATALPENTAGADATRLKCARNEADDHKARGPHAFEIEPGAPDKR